MTQTIQTPDKKNESTKKDSSFPPVTPVKEPQITPNDQPEKIEADQNEKPSLPNEIYEETLPPDTRVVG